MSDGMVFHSKIDAWLIWLVRLAFVAALVPIAFGAIRQPEKGTALLLSVVIVAATAVFTEWTFHSTKYTIDGGSLLVQSGIFHWQIPIAQIESMMRTRNPLSSPAASLDRLAIQYGEGQSLMISPEDRDRFIEAVKAINPAIRT